MKIFDCVKPWPRKVNFVDKNNRMVGFDFSQSCCEDFGYFFSAKPQEIHEDHLNPSDADLEPFEFDREFFHEGNESVTFKLVNGDEVLYLTLYNQHNGYYSHGFDFTEGDTHIRDGCI